MIRRVVDIDFNPETTNEVVTHITLNMNNMTPERHVKGKAYASKCLYKGSTYSKLLLSVN